MRKNLPVANPLGTDTTCEECVVPTQTSIDNGKCVKCPFCHKVVNAVVTDAYIQCPACQTKVTK